MKIIVITRTPALAAMGMTALLTLTACSGSSETCDFTEAPMEATSSIEFTIPQELAELNQGYLENRVFDSVTVTSIETEDASACALEYSYDYADGGLDRLLEYAEGATEVLEGKEAVEEHIADYLNSDNQGDIELAEDFQ